MGASPSTTFHKTFLHFIGRSPSFGGWSFLNDENQRVLAAMIFVIAGFIK